MERSVIAGLFSEKESSESIESKRSELESLLRSAGGFPVNFFFQKKNAVNGKYLLGKGKIDEINKYIKENDIDIILFYNKLGYVQQRNLEAITGIKIIDRTGLILDVFALHARTVKGKLQVELAQLLYLLPRLKGKGVEMSRLGGGIGTRGPGEKKLETDRRKIKKRINIIKKRLKKLTFDRKNIRRKRDNSPIPVISLAGYTSSGKSTLFNVLSDEDTFVAAKMFSTLDPLVRKMNFQGGKNEYYCFITDTVGFIREMPPEIMEAFKSTLEEIASAELILNVIDISDRDFDYKKRVSGKIFSDLGITEDKILNVYNKTDLINNSQYENLYSGSEMKMDEVYISAKENRGIEELRSMIFKKVFSEYQKYRIVIKKSGDISMKNIDTWAIVLRKISNPKEIVYEVLTGKEKMLKFISLHSEVLYEVIK